MGYETEVPPVPDRLTEEIMIKQIKKSFKDQPYTVFEIPDSMRTRKMSRRQNVREYNFTWFGNFVRGVLISGIFLFPLGLIFRKTGLGIPTFDVPRMYSRSSTNHHYIYRARNYKAIKYIVPIWGLVSYMYANAKTGLEIVFDEDYSKISSAILAYDS